MNRSPAPIRLSILLPALAATVSTLSWPAQAVAASAGRRIDRRIGAGDRFMAGSFRERRA